MCTFVFESFCQMLVAPSCKINIWMHRRSPIDYSNTCLTHLSTPPQVRKYFISIQSLSGAGGSQRYNEIFCQVNSSRIFSLSSVGRAPRRCTTITFLSLLKHLPAPAAHGDTQNSKFGTNRLFISVGVCTNLRPCTVRIPQTSLLSLDSCILTSHWTPQNDITNLEFL